MAVTWIVVPAYNEDDNLVDVMPRIVAQLSTLSPEGKLLIVDDGSTRERP